MHPYHTIETLALAASGSKPARLAVLGKPVSHSASPQLHQPALDALGIDASYVRLQVDPGDLPKAFELMSRLGFIGCNVTVPHKFEAMECCSEVSDQAKLLGAVNTVVFRDGATVGYNTDGPGFREAISGSFGLDLGKSRTLILGAGGGAGQAIATQCALGNPPEITLVNRDIAKLGHLAEKLRGISPETEIHAIGFGDPSLRGRCHEADLIVQTTSLGLKTGDAEVIPESHFAAGICAYDTIYQPPETPFLAAAKRAGCKTDNGLSLLIHQGAIAFQHWFPGTDPMPHMRRAMNRAR